MAKKFEYHYVYIQGLTEEEILDKLNGHGEEGWRVVAPLAHGGLPKTIFLLEREK